MSELRRVRRQLSAEEKHSRRLEIQAKQERVMYYPSKEIYEFTYGKVDESGNYFPWLGVQMDAFTYPQENSDHTFNPCDPIKPKQKWGISRRDWEALVKAGVSTNDYEINDQLK